MQQLFFKDRLIRTETSTLEGYITATEELLEEIQETDGSASDARQYEALERRSYMFV
jgi:hypothetical protein